jgi:hypothetical protein
VGEKVMSLFGPEISEIDQLLLMQEGRLDQAKTTLIKIIKLTKGKDVPDDIEQIILNIPELKRLNKMFDDIWGKDIKEMEFTIRENYKD